jgi:hypothetical protein
LRYYPFPLLFGAAKASELTLEGLNVGAVGVELLYEHGLHDEVEWEARVLD